MAEATPEALQQAPARKIKWKDVRESFTGYIFIAPAFLIIFIFGLFPIVFSVYVSLYQWRINPGDYIALGNYTRAFGNLAYIVAFWVAAIFLYLAARSFQKIWREASSHGARIWLWAVPSLLLTAALGLFTRFFFLFLPEILAIATKVRGQTTSQDLFVKLLGEAWQAPVVQESLKQFLLVFTIGLIVTYLVYRIFGNNSKYLSDNNTLINAFTMLGLSIGLFWLTWTEIQGAYTAALEEGIELEIWAQIVTISAGFGLLLISWLTWRSGVKQDSNLGMILKLVAAAMLAVGAWVLIAELPRIVQAGDDGWWQGLLVTVYYAIGTVPLQLFLALFLAVLLFQEIKGKGLYRLIFFLPYITPAVAAAAVFRVLFSGRPNGPINSLLGAFGVEPLLWLDEPTGIFRMITGGILPEWAAGPSLALAVIIIYNIWSYVGYDIVIFLAGLGGIPGELYEAAAIDGAGRWEKFRHVTLPLLSPTTYFLTLLSVIGTFKAFNHVWVLRKAAALGTTDTASIVIFTEFNRNTRYGYASSLAIILLLIILVLTVINNRIAEEKVFYG